MGKLHMMPSLHFTYPQATSLCDRRTESQHSPSLCIHTPLVYERLSMGVVSMATDHSTDTNAKLLKANYLETDSLWALCVDLCVYVCLRVTLCCV